VDGLRRARLDLAVDADDPLAAHGLGNRECRRIRIGDDLGEAVMVAQVDEEEAAMVAHAMDPAREADGLADIGLSQLCAGVAAVTMHGNVFRLSEACEGRDTRPEIRAEKRMGGMICQGNDGWRGARDAAPELAAIILVRSLLFRSLF